MGYMSSNTRRENTAMTIFSNRIEAILNVASLALCLNIAILVLIKIT